MKKIIIAALSMILGSFGYVIVDSTIENRVNNLESSYSVLQEQFLSHCDEMIPTADSDETQKELGVGDFLKCINLQSKYKMVSTGGGYYYAKFFGDEIYTGVIPSDYVDTTPTSTETTVPTTIPSTTFPTTVTEEEATTANHSEINEDVVGTFSCIHYPEYDLNITKATGQIISKEIIYKTVYDENYAETRVKGKNFTVEFVFEGEISPKLAGETIDITGYINGSDSYWFGDSSYIERDGTFRIVISRSCYFPSGYSPNTFELSNISIH